MSNTAGFALHETLFQELAELRERTARVQEQYAHLNENMHEMETRILQSIERLEKKTTWLLIVLAPLVGGTAGGMAEALKLLF